MISSIKPKSEELLILLNMIHFIERIIRLASCSVETKENLIISISDGFYELFILNNLEAHLYFIINKRLAFFFVNLASLQSSNACRQLFLGGINRFKNIRLILLTLVDKFLQLGSDWRRNTLAPLNGTIKLDSKQEVVFCIYYCLDELWRLNFPERKGKLGDYLVL